MQKRLPAIDLDEAPHEAPAPMTNLQAQQLARRAFGRRRGKVQRRAGETWEHALHVALASEGR